MAKKTTPKKTAQKKATQQRTTLKKTATVKGRGVSAAKSASREPQAKRTPVSQVPADRPDVDEEYGGRGAPIEHYHGEPNRGKRTGEPGSLEEETLDRDAPYNKTYGRIHEEHGGN